MNIRTTLLLFVAFSISTCNNENVENDFHPTPPPSSENTLDLDQANQLAALPLKCIQTSLPYKSGITIADSTDLQFPQHHHPAFYGCFDWHSAVHGHWVLVNLLKKFPNLENREKIVELLDTHLSDENIAIEIEYFAMNKYSKNFERTYGWAWLLKLTEELYSWNDSLGEKWYKNLKPLAEYLANRYVDYLPKLAYPIRIGTHSNTAFGLSFAWDYAEKTENSILQNAIREKAFEFYANDQNCPISWEPSGYDFLSPCLEEARIMQRILSAEEFKKWFAKFLPEFNSSQNDLLEPAIILDRSDGGLVHLDGLNFSRAWCLYPIASAVPELYHLKKLANEHLDFSLGNIVDGDYAGEHWLASFALYAFNSRE